MISDPFIFKVLDISTRHLAKEDNERLEAAKNGPTLFYELQEYGWLVFVGEVDENWPEEDWGSDFRNVLKLAQALECDYVRFDRDGREYDELPKFEW